MSGRAHRVDALIVGGGPAGAAAAITLRQRHLNRVVVLDDRDRAAPRIGESIPPDTRPLLQKLGVWPDFVAQNHDPCLGSRSAWGSEALGHNDFLYNLHGPGWHLDRRRFDALLLDVAERSGVGVFHGCRAGEISRLDNFRFLIEATGRTFETSLLIDATGSRRHVARQLGAEDRVHDRLLCVASFFDDPRDLGHLTLLEAVEEGWWYAAALPDGRAVAMLATDPALARERRLARPEGWNASLQSTLHVASALGKLPEEPELFAKAAPSSLLSPLCGPGWLAVGDAASAYDPLSAQGIYKALATGHHGALAAVQALQGEMDALRAYHQFVVRGFIDFLRNANYLYGLESRWPDSPFWQRRRAPIPSQPRVSESSSRHQERRRGFP